MSGKPKSEFFYALLVDEEDARACKDITDDACKEVPGNFIKLLLAQFFTKIADSLASTKVVLPWVMASAGIPAFFSGLLVPIRESGSLLPQLLIAHQVRGFGVRKGFLVAGSIVQALALLLIGWVVANFSGVLAGCLIVGALVLFSLARGLVSVASKDVIGKTIPKKRRGRLTGYGASLAGLCILAVGVTFYVPYFDLSSNVTLLLILSALLLLISAIYYGVVVEYSGATEGGESGFLRALQRVKLIKTDKNFAHFVIARALMMGSGISAPFFVLAAQTASGEGASLINLGLFIVLTGLAGSVSGFIWGKFADINSQKIMVITAAITSVICVLAGVMITNQNSVPWVFVTLYFILAVVHEGVRISRKTYLLDIATGQQRTDYVAVSNTIIGLLLLVIGLITAAIANVSMAVLFGVFAAMSILACFVSVKLAPVAE